MTVFSFEKNTSTDGSGGSKSRLSFLVFFFCVFFLYELLKATIQ